MTIFRDFLVWYNNLDVGPLSPLWRDCNSFTLIEIPICLKLPSVPGIARKMVFDTSKGDGAVFMLLDENN